MKGFLVRWRGFLNRYAPDPAVGAVFNRALHGMRAAEARFPKRWRGFLNRDASNPRGRRGLQPRSSQHARGRSTLTEKATFNRRIWIVKGIKIWRELPRNSGASLPSLRHYHGRPGATHHRRLRTWKTTQPRHQSHRPAYCGSVGAAHGQTRRVRMRRGN